MMRGRQVSKGFTLIECVIALCIAALALSAWSYALTYNLRLLHSADERMNVSFVMDSAYAHLVSHRWHMPESDSASYTVLMGRDAFRVEVKRTAHIKASGMDKLLIAVYHARPLHGSSCLKSESVYVGGNHVGS